MTIVSIIDSGQCMLAGATCAVVSREWPDIDPLLRTNKRYVRYRCLFIRYSNTLSPIEFLVDK